MAEVSVALIKQLRDRTGAGLMDCKGALAACDCDIEKATDYLREKGLAKVAKKADRIAAEGLALYKTCEQCGRTVILEVNCETDFVAKGDQFREFVLNIASLILKNDCKDIDTAKELSKDLVAEATVKMGEKFDLRRFEILAKEDGAEIGTYIHMQGKIATVVLVKGADAELAKGLAMHIAANNPAYINLSDVPADVYDHEKGIVTEQMKADPKLAGKPEMALTKILEGKLNKVFSEQTLTAQAYLLDDTKTVGQVLTEKKASVIKFVRYAVGEGIEKRHDDFASEVMKEVNK